MFRNISKSQSCHPGSAWSLLWPLFSSAGNRLLRWYTNILPEIGYLIFPQIMLYYLVMYLCSSLLFVSPALIYSPFILYHSFFYMTSTYCCYGLESPFEVHVWGCREKKVGSTAAVLIEKGFLVYPNYEYISHDASFWSESRWKPESCVKPGLGNHSWICVGPELLCTKR